MDFYELEYRNVKTKDSGEYTEVFPVFLNEPSRDVMVKDGKFYAIWDDQEGLWKTNTYDVVRLVDSEIEEIVNKKNKPFIENGEKLKYVQRRMSKENTKLFKTFIDWCKIQDDSFKVLNKKVIFQNTKTRKTDYCSFRLPYNLDDENECPAYDELVSTLYSAEERQKFEWAIGSIIAGDSIDIQKAIAFYGKPGTGKSTILEIIENMFTRDDNDTYVGPIVTKAIADQNDNFGAAPLADYKLVLMDNDANLSRLNENSVLNTIISHETTRSNAKYGKDKYIKPIGFLFMATNNWINIPETKSGLRRRFIIVEPTNEKIQYQHYMKLKRQINEELGAIAFKCLTIYKALGKDAYDEYEPIGMFEISNPVYNFMEDLYFDPHKYCYNYVDDGLSLNTIWGFYKTFCEDAGFKICKKGELKNDLYEYFDEVLENYYEIKNPNIKHRYFFRHLKESMFEKKVKNAPKKKEPVLDSDDDWLDLKEQPSEFDKLCKDCPAQLSSNEKTPDYRWENVETKLSDLDTHALHYIRPMPYIIMADFDLAKGKANEERTIEDIFEVAKEFPPTYAELSKGGGLHLYYIYDGDIGMLASKYNNDRRNEIKVYPADKKSAIRRKLTKCNNLKVAVMPENFLPLKENKKKVIKDGIVKNEITLRILVTKALNREIKDTESTTQCIHFIHMILDEAYNDGYYYDLTDLEQAVFQFASKSTHQAEHCLDLFDQMHFKSKNADELTTQDVSIPVGDDRPIAFYDIEVFPNLFVLCYAFEEGDVIVMENPTPEELEMFVNSYRLVGFYNLDYDNIVVHKRIKMKLDNLHTYYVSKELINSDSKPGKTAAKYVSYTDIYDYLPTYKRQSLKEFEIDLDIHHEELGLDWNEPVPEALWPKVEKYCCYDVEATRTLWFATQPEFKAREILADLTGMTVNDSTNILSQQLIFEDEKYPQIEFNYRFMGECEPGHTCVLEDDGITCVQDDGKIIFPGYKYDGYVSSYLDVPKVGEGGYIYYEPGMYDDVWTFDIAGQHPASIIAEQLFGPNYTKVFADIVQLRLYIKHKDFESARKMFGGRLAKYLDNPDDAKALAGALKVVVNAVYGMTYSDKQFRCRDERNIDNIVAKRGSLFMINLRYLVQKMGYTVIHCKTDSIKVQHPDEKVINFINEYGKRFGYTFEIEHKFEKICLVNKAVYIAKVTTDDAEWLDVCEDAKKKGLPEPTRWTATGTQFAVPYVFKSLFSKEPITFKDYCEKKKVQGAIFKDMNEDLPDVSLYERIKQTRGKIEREVKVTNRARLEAEEYSWMTNEQLDEEIEKGHNRMFVGKVGNFVPVLPGSCGGILLRYDEKTDKYSAVTGTNGWRWQEAEIVKKLGMEDKVDTSYHQDLADKAVDAINKYGDFEWFVS